MLISITVLGEVGWHVTFYVALSVCSRADEAEAEAVQGGGWRCAARQGLHRAGTSTEKPTLTETVGQILCMIRIP